MALLERFRTFNLRDVGDNLMA